MKKIDPYEDEPFDFSRGRRFTREEREGFRKAIERKLGRKIKPRGRIPKLPAEKYRPVYILLHPKVLKWARECAKREGIGYQTVINETLLRAAA